MLFNIHKLFVSISYGITVHNEHQELDKLLGFLTSNIDNNDEIIVLQDVTQKDEATTKVINRYKDRIKHIEARLNSDFATFKNNLIEYAKCKYLFQIDADELPQQHLVESIKKIIFRKCKYDCFLVPRINIVDGLTPDHIQKWNWKLNEKGYVNFPDHQLRVFKLNGAIKWINRVHEGLTGFKRAYYIPADENNCLWHVKSIDRQEKQNDLYDTIPHS
ncbi:glycosyltransferase [Mucilaginibacter roseus]|uniref:Glycosyltransferase n=1 Tax=Mucilaginibacter roseus TaxID=1528868 RepID=A0ABS8U3U8_9SPHI|nr:glycosyltransferase [Mucilaginibacter roseus]MCD8740718.1 glycosyltransferase [Mucilaginibacter roseus]